MEELKDRLKQLRGKLTQDNFAQLIDIHRNTISRWEKGLGEPGAKELAKISQKLGIELNWLVLGVGNKNINVSTQNVRHVGQNQMSPISQPIDKFDKCLDEMSDTPENMRYVAGYSENKKAQTIENCEKPPDKMCDTSHILKIQQELVEAIKEQNRLIRENSSLQIQLKERDQRIKEFEREIERLRGELSLAKSRAAGAQAG